MFMSFSFNQLPKETMDAMNLNQDNRRCENCKAESVVFDHATGEKFAVDAELLYL